MELIKKLTWYDIFYVKYVNQYWVINRDIEAKEADADNLSAALAKAEALDYSLSKFISEGKYEEPRTQ